MNEQNFTDNEQEMTCEDYREKLKKIFDEMTDLQALRFFYRYVSGVAAETPYIFEKGETWTI